MIFKKSIKELKSINHRDELAMSLIDQEGASSGIMSRYAEFDAIPATLCLDHNGPPYLGWCVFISSNGQQLTFLSSCQSNALKIKKIP